MAKKRLNIKDKTGLPVDYDISAENVTIDGAGGKPLTQKLDEITETEAQAVRSITFNGQSYSRNNGIINIGEQEQPNWNESNPNYRTYIRNKPTLLSQFTNDCGFVTSSQIPEGADLSTVFASVAYDPTTSRINFFGKGSNTVLAYLDAAPFIVDGMVENVTLDSSTNELVITFNTASGKSPIRVPLGSISGQGTVQSVKMNGGTPIQPVNGVIDLGTVITEHQSLSSYATKNEMSVSESNGVATIQVKENNSAEVYTKSKTDELLGTKANDNAVVKSVTINGTTPTLNNGNVNLGTIQSGEDGITPHIDPISGNWMLGTTDTTVHAQGPQGNSGVASADEVEVVNNLTEGGTTEEVEVEGETITKVKVLSAEMGKQLNNTKAPAEQITIADYSTIEGVVFLDGAYINGGKIKSHNLYKLVCIPYKVDGEGIRITGYNANAGYGYMVGTPAIGADVDSTDAPTFSSGVATFPNASADGYALFHLYNSTIYATDGVGFLKVSSSTGMETPNSETLLSLNGGCITKQSMSQGDVLPKLASLIGEPKNLLNPEDILENYYIQPSNGTVLSGNGYVTAVVKNVRLNGSFVFSSNNTLLELSKGFNGICIQPHFTPMNSCILFYATGANFSLYRVGWPFGFEIIDDGQGGFKGFKISGELDVPCDIYIYVGSKGLESNLQFEKGSIPTEFEEYGTEHSVIGTDWSPVIAGLAAQIGALQAALENAEAVPSRWAGCRYVAFGDSITDEYYEPKYKYTSYIKDALGCTSYLNKGQSGATAAQNPPGASNPSSWQNYLGRYIRQVTFNNYDLATILIGVNDKTYNVPLGTIDSTEDTTFLGALNDAISYMISANPNLRIVLFTPFNTKSSTANSLGLNVADYADAVKLIGKKYSLPVIDLYSEAGICPNNWSTFTGDSLHPNAAGHQWAAGYIIGQLKNL